MQACSFVNLGLALPTTLINLTLIVAIVTSNECKKPCQELLLNLAFTDLLTGVTSMPFHFVEFRLIAFLKDPCQFSNVAIPLGYAIGLASFLTVTVIAVERYVKIFCPYVYHARFKPSTVIVFLLVIWAISVIGVIPTAVTQNAYPLHLFAVLVAVFGSTVNVYCYLRILLRARKTRRQIETEVSRFGRAVPSQRERNLLFIGGLIIISLSLSYTPIVLSKLVKVLGIRGDAWDYALCWEWTLAMANSLMNPVISCVFNPVVRMKIVRMWTCKANDNRMSRRESRENNTIIIAMQSFRMKNM